MNTKLQWDIKITKRQWEHFMHSKCNRSNSKNENQHNCLVVYRRRLIDFWIKTYWVRCIYCDELSGPWRTMLEAQAVCVAFNTLENMWVSVEH